MRYLHNVLTSVCIFAFSVRAGPQWDSCLTSSEAESLASDFGASLANKIIPNDFYDCSDSIRDLESAGCTVDPQPLDAFRAEFAADQLNVPSFPLQIINVWHSCDIITFRWESPQTPKRVIGLVVLKTVHAPASSSQKHLINTTYSEFNTAAWLANIGIFKPANCTKSA